ncbi:LacI family DNA-binding transcriptional regulator [Streptomyces sp. NPDC047981]|uniref:LacI family DNA-binding transcriptional regulator n=1 Tax=Streptomyces sp. NPDC047981 TaxID=3154610 RepID=UPI00341D8C6A
MQNVAGKDRREQDGVTMAGTPKPTLAKVAERAGVSVASVSRVLNGLPATPEMTKRVTEAAEALSYVPDAFARSLRAGRTFQVALAVADIGNPTYVAMMRTVEAALRPTNYRIVLYSTGTDTDGELAFVESLRSGTVDGLILQTVRARDELLEALAELPMPAVVIGNLPDGADVDCVRTDSGLGIGLAVRHLADMGRRRIALLNGPVETAPGRIRLQGFEEAMRARGCTVEPGMVMECADFNHHDGYLAAAALLEEHAPDAIVCANDLIAMGALRALTERGLRIPQDVAVTGMDDTDLAAMCNPPLTTVSLGAEERAGLAVELLRERIEDHERPVACREVVPSLVVRESSRSVDQFMDRS